MSSPQAARIIQQKRPHTTSNHATPNGWPTRRTIRILIGGNNGVAAGLLIVEAV